MGDDELTLPVTLGRYQLLSKIASGGAATVYLARMLGKAGFERRVAVKVLHSHLASDPEFVAMFLDEARLAARIHHPNVVGVHDVDAVGGQLIIVMDYVEGAALSWLWRKSRKLGEPMPIGFAANVVRDALLGLHAAHELIDGSGHRVGLVHRDVSPQNLLVGADGVTRVTDFGIAKARGRIATTQDANIVKGKLRYLAPEQVQRGSLDHRVDIFAAGIVLWEALVGEVLFKGDTEASIIGQLVTARVTPPSAHRQQVSVALDEVCMRALSRDPEARFPSAQAFADALDEAAGELFFRPRQLCAYVHAHAESRIAKARDAMRSIGEVRPESGEATLADLESISGDLAADGRARQAPPADGSDPTTGATDTSLSLSRRPTSSSSRWRPYAGGALLIGLGALGAVGVRGDADADPLRLTSAMAQAAAAIPTAASEPARPEPTATSTASAAPPASVSAKSVSRPPPAGAAPTPRSPPPAIFIPDNL